MVTWLKIFEPNDSTKKLSQEVLIQVTSNRSQTRFIIEKLRTRKEEQSFWYRTPATANRIATAVDFFNAAKLKARIINYMWHYFSNRYQE